MADRDIVERLRCGAHDMDRNIDWQAMDDAADEITRLRAQLEVAHAASEAAISKAQWQAVTNRELNEAQDEITRLRADLATSMETVAKAQALQAEMLRERAALAQPLPSGWHEAVQRLVTGFEHVSGIARQWEPDHSSGADRAKWARATEACADVARLLAASPQAPTTKE